MVAKQPAPGQTKTRLCPPLTGELAAELYTCFLADTLDIMRGVSGVDHVIAYSPEDAAGYFQGLAPDFGLTPQRGASLGERLDNLLTAALAAGAHQAVVMDSDSPTLPPAYIAAAFDHLAAGADVVLGPCQDGGYYLIGVTGPQPRLLREVPMSTPTVLRDTLALAAEIGVRVALLPPWYDVDTANELAHLRAELATAGEEVAVHTRRFIASQNGAWPT
ncbi:MAG: TIGR04282 family arsenosugar biosynthesis glycosyltransferase [Anaerolineales bacterium]|nr:TIGR04282 family arsenosugar biosynthesis glycosyltransferase [Anaerolineales bacterium]